MTVTTRRATRRPATRATIAVLFVLGVTALAGGAAMVMGLGNERTRLPDEWLTDIPLIDSWTIPGLVLGIGFGLGSLFVGFGMVRRAAWTWTEPITRLTGHHWTWIATIVLGFGHVLWIALQLIFIPEPSGLQAFYGAIGLSLTFLPLTRSVRTELGAAPNQ